MGTILYISTVMKFVAVPMAIFELLPQKRKGKIDLWLLNKFPKIIKSFLTTFAVLYIFILLLIYTGPYLVIIVFVFERPIIWGLTVLFDMEFESVIIFTIVLFLVILVFSIIEWLIPESWIIFISIPLEFFSDWANHYKYIGILVPDYNAVDFLRFFDETFTSIEDWLWDWLSSVSVIYFFFARGFMLAIIITIQILIVIVLVSCCIVVIGAPINVYIRFSEFVRYKFNIEKGSVVFGALIIYAIGESLEFLIKTWEYFHIEG